MDRRGFLKVAASSALAGSAILGEAAGMGRSERRGPAIRTRKATMDRQEVAQYLHGPFMSLAPSFNQDGSLDFAGVRRFIDRSIDAGSKTILITGGDSHLISLSEKENAELTKVACEHIAGRAMVVAADWEFNTPKATEYAEYVRDIGASVLMLKPPIWSTVTPESLADHYATVSKILPVMMVTAFFRRLKPTPQFGLDTIEMAIAKSDKVVAVKDDLFTFPVKLAEMVRGTGVIAFAGGYKSRHLTLHKHGSGHSYLSTFQVFAPDIVRRYWKAIEEDDLVTAQAVIDDYEKPWFDFVAGLDCRYCPAFHGTLALHGINQKWLPKPYVTISDEELERLAEFLRSKSML